MYLKTVAISFQDIIEDVGRTEIFVGEGKVDVLETDAIHVADVKAP